MEEQQTRKTYYVYKVTCTLNGKIYIGKSSYTEHMNTSYLGSGRYIRAAVKKYGRSFFKKEVLFETEDSRLAYREEALLIAKFNSTNHALGYNISKGYAKTDEYLNQDYRTVISLSSKRMWEGYSAEQRKAHCDAIRASWTPERREARSAMMVRRMADPDAAALYRANLSKGVKRALEDENKRARHKEAMNRPDVRRRIHTARLAQGQDPWQQKLNKQVRQPLSVVARLLKCGKLTEAEALEKRKELLLLRDQLLKERK